MADFGVMEDGHPDEVILPGSNQTHGTSSNETPQAKLGNAGDSTRSTHGAPPPKPMQAPTRPLARTGSNGPPPRVPNTPNQPPHRPGAPIQGRPHPNHPANPNQAAARPPPARPPQQQQPSATIKTGTPPPNGVPSEPVAFFSARSVTDAPESAPPGTAAVAIQGAKLFDPRAESPSIRKTAGIDHHSSRPVAKTGQHVPPQKRDLDQPRAPSPRPGNAGLNNGPSGVGAARPAVGNPMLNNARQIGVPGAVGSPLANRNSYKPPTVKRPVPGTTDNGNRPPLTDVSPNGVVSAPGGGGGGADAKRQKIT